jgi:hypothetical protein
MSLLDHTLHFISMATMGGVQHNTCYIKRILTTCCYNSTFIQVRKMTSGIWIRVALVRRTEISEEYIFWVMRLWVFPVRNKDMLNDILNCYWREKLSQKISCFKPTTFIQITEGQILCQWATEEDAQEVWNQRYSILILRIKLMT